MTLYKSVILFLYVICCFLTRIRCQEIVSEQHLKEIQEDDFLDHVTRRKLYAMHPLNRSEIVISLNTTDDYCYLDNKDLNVFIHYTFNEYDQDKAVSDSQPIETVVSLDKSSGKEISDVFSHDLLLNIRDEEENELISSFSYRPHELNLLSLPITTFSSSPGVSHLSFTLYDNTTKRTIDDGKIRFFNPCLPRPSKFQQFVVVPLIDNPAMILITTSVGVVGRTLYDFFSKNPQFRPGKGGEVALISSSSSSDDGDNDDGFGSSPPHSTQGSLYRGDEKSAFYPSNRGFKSYMNSLTSRANGVSASALPATLTAYPAMKLLTSTSSLASSDPTFITNDEVATEPGTRTIAYHEQSLVSSGFRNNRMISFKRKTREILSKNKLMFRTVAVLSGIAFLLSSKGNDMDQKLSSTLRFSSRKLAKSLISTLEKNKNKILSGKVSIGKNPFSSSSDLASSSSSSSSTSPLFMKVYKESVFSRDIRGLFRSLTISSSSSSSRSPVASQSSITGFSSNHIKNSSRFWKSIAAVIIQAGLFVLQQRNIVNINTSEQLTIPF
jgi:hypothetical protein